MNVDAGPVRPVAPVAAEGAGSPVRRWRASARPRLPGGEALWVTLLYAAYAVFLTWPLVTHLNGLLAGTGIAGDTGGAVGQVSYVVQHNIFPFAPATFHGLNAPEGVSQTWVLNIASLPSNVLLYGLSYIFGAVAGSNLVTLLGFVLSGLSMFLLVRRLFGSAGAGLLAGFAFAFYPFAVDKINGHYIYMDGFALVLGVWRMLELIDRPTVRNALLAGAAVTFGMWWTPYFILIGGVAFAVMEVVFLVTGALRGRGRDAVKLAAVAVVPVFVVFVALGVLTIVAGGSSTGTVRSQDLTELYTYSARILEWLLPDRHNLIFGGATGPYLTSHLHGSNFSESSLYLGLSVIALAFAGAALAARRVQIARLVAVHDLRVVAVFSGVLLALVAAWFSSPPKVHLLGVWVPMPSDIIFHFTSTWRVYTRFVELIELGLCLPLGYAVARLVTGRRPLVAATVVAGLAAVLVLDLWARPPVRTVSAAAPPEIMWLRDHPGGIVADYPLYPAVYPDYTPIFEQMEDHHPLFQGYDSNSYDESMKLGLADLADPRTASDLADFGVRYVIVRPGAPGGDPQSMIRHHYRLRFASPDGVSVWQVDAAPAPTRVDVLSNFWLLEGSPPAEYRWMNGPGVLGVYARNCSTTCRGRLTFESNSASTPRFLTIRDQRTGQILMRTWVPAVKTIRVVVPDVTLRDGSARLVLSTVPGPAVSSHGDPRTLSIVVQQPQLTLLGGGR